MRTTPYGRTPSSRNFARDAAGFAHLPDESLASSAPPMADPPPVGGQTGATTDPTSRPKRAHLVGQSRQVVIARIDADVRFEQEQIHAIELHAIVHSRAAAVRWSMVSRSIGGSESGPLPTRPGHMALWTRGKLDADLARS